MSRSDYKDHTPGPWQSDSHRTQDGGYPIVMAKGLEPVAIIHKGNVRAEADARLITAAPDLLAACERTLEYLQKVSSDADLYHAEATEPLRAAIAKARGTQ